MFYGGFKVFGRPSRACLFDPPTCAELGVAVRALRHERGLSLEALAHAAGMHTTYLSGIERGNYTPSWKKLGALAEALDVPISEIVLRADGA